MYHGLIDGVRGFVREHTRAEAGDELSHVKFFAQPEHIFLHHDVVPPELDLGKTGRRKEEE